MKKAVLIIHGFAGELKDHIYLEKRLKNEGYDVYTFLLPGHEKKFIRNVNRYEWLEAAENQLKILLDKNYDEITVFGHSMGSLIAGFLATKYPNINKLVLSSPPYQFLKSDENGIHLFKSIALGIKLLSDKDKIEKTATKRIFRVAPSVTGELIKLSKERHDDPKKINIPTLILEGSNDLLVPFESVMYVYNNIKSNYKDLTILNDVKHPIFRSTRNDIATDKMISFLKTDCNKEYNSIMYI